MKTRCYNKNREDWKNYGARGIKVCVEWQDFENFRADMHASFLRHTKKHGLRNTTLDRIHVNEDYSKANCRWATKKEQCGNKRDSFRFLYHGKELSVSEIASLYGRPYMTIYCRIKDGIDLDRPYRQLRTPKTKNIRTV